MVVVEREARERPDEVVAAGEHAPVQSSRVLDLFLGEVVNFLIVAAVLLTLLPEVLRGFADYRMIIYSLLIIVLMIARPQGLFAFRRQRN